MDDEHRVAEHRRDRQVLEDLPRGAAADARRRRPATAAAADTHARTSGEDLRSSLSRGRGALARAAAATPSRRSLALARGRLVRIRLSDSSAWRATAIRTVVAILFFFGPRNARNAPRPGLWFLCCFSFVREKHTMHRDPDGGGSAGFPLCSRRETHTQKNTHTHLDKHVEHHVVVLVAALALEAVHRADRAVLSCAEGRGGGLVWRARASRRGGARGGVCEREATWCVRKRRTASVAGARAREREREREPRPPPRAAHATSSCTAPRTSPPPLRTSWLPRFMRRVPSGAPR